MPKFTPKSGETSPPQQPTLPKEIVQKPQVIGSPLPFSMLPTGNAPNVRLTYTVQEGDVVREHSWTDAELDNHFTEIARKGITFSQAIGCVWYPYHSIRKVIVTPL